MFTRGRRLLAKLRRESVSSLEEEALSSPKEGVLANLRRNSVRSPEDEVLSSPEERSISSPKEGVFTLT